MLAGRSLITTETLTYSPAVTTRAWYLSLCIRRSRGYRRPTRTAIASDPAVDSDGWMLQVGADGNAVQPDPPILV